MSKIKAQLPVHAEIFPEDIVEAIHDHDDILDFILEMDQEVEDYHFTKELIEKLQKRLNLEE